MAIREADGPITFRRGGYGRTLTFAPNEGVKQQMSAADLLLAGIAHEAREAKRKAKFKPSQQRGKNKIMQRLDAIADSLRERLVLASVGGPTLRKIK
jgi:hypothetical protein